MIKLLILLILFYQTTSEASGFLYPKNSLKYDTIKEAISILHVGIKSQRERMKIVSQNLANEHSTGLSPTDLPYRRKTIHFRDRFDPKTQNFVIKKVTYGHDYTDFKMVYDPSHPAANQSGLVKYPNVEKQIELRDADETQRSIEASQAAISKAIKMDNSILDLIRR